MIRRLKLVGMAAVILAVWAIPFNPVSLAQEKLRYSCSSQVFEALEKERLKTFTKATGIEVDLQVTSSAAAVERLLAGESHIAGIARSGTHPSKEGGMIETPFCKDSLTIIVNAKNRVTNITEEQLRDIFNRKITNWKQVGGKDEAIFLVVPGKHTAAHENFGRMILKGKEIKYDVMTYLSSTAIEAVKRFPTAISFITQGAIGKAGGIKMVWVNGLSPKDKGYPYVQEFSFITKGNPEGAVKTFVDFALSVKGREIIGRQGMIPVGP